jgi:hypothetical protein
MATAAAAAAVAPRGPILTLRFQGAAPPPHPPVTDPTPDEQFEIDLAAKARQQAEKDAAAAATAAAGSASGTTLGAIGGFFSKAVAVVDKAVGDAHSSGERQVREWERKQGEEKFTLNFPELVAAGAKFVVQYSATVMHQGQQVSGTVFISSTHLAFASDTIKDAFPLSTIASIQRSVALKTAENGPPFIMPIPAPHVLPSCIQFFMVDTKVLQFLEFDNIAAKAGAALTTTVKGRPIDRFYNWSDHWWRKSVQIPVPGVTYASY